MRLTAHVKKVGNSLAIFIPADKARAANLREGDVVDAELEPHLPTMVGMFKGLGPWTVADKKWGWPEGDAET